jgi:hypothetical protein
LFLRGVVVGDFCVSRGEDFYSEIIIIFYDNSS